MANQQLDRFLIPHPLPPRPPEDEAEEFLRGLAEFLVPVGDVVGGAMGAVGGVAGGAVRGVAEMNPEFIRDTAMPALDNVIKGAEGIQYGLIEPAMKEPAGLMTLGQKAWNDKSLSRFLAAQSDAGVEDSDDPLDRVRKVARHYYDNESIPVFTGAMEMLPSTLLGPKSLSGLKPKPSVTPLRGLDNPSGVEAILGKEALNPAVRSSFTMPATKTATTAGAEQLPTMANTAAQATVRLRPENFAETRAAAQAKLADPAASEDVIKYAQEVIDSIDDATVKNLPEARFRTLPRTNPETVSTAVDGTEVAPLIPDDVQPQSFTPDPANPTQPIQTSNTLPTSTTAPPRVSPNAAITQTVGNQGTVPPPPVPPVAQAGNAVPTPAAPTGDLLNTRSVADVLKDPNLRDTGFSGKVREFMGKFGRASRGLERIHPGITKPADDIEAVTNEFRTLRTKYEGTGNAIRQVLDNSAKTDPANLHLEIGSWTGKAIDTAMNNGASAKWVANKTLELQNDLAGKAPHAQAEIAANFIDKMLTRAAEKWAVDAYDAIGKKPGSAARLHLAKTAGTESVPLVTGINNALTMIGASTDLSFAGIQLAMTAPRHPIAFAKSLGTAVRTAADPQYMGKFYAKNMDTVLDATNHGLVVSRGGLADALMGGADVEKAIGDIPIAGGIFSGSNRMFASAADAMRINMWKGLRNGAFKNSSEEELRELAKLLNRATGMTSTQTTGVEQQVLFASRFFRSPLEMVGMIRSPGKVGEEARAIVGTFAGGASLFTYMLNNALGKETILDPDDPNFLRVQARDAESGGLDVSLYGPLHPYIQAFAKAAKHGPMKAAQQAAENGLDPAVAMTLLTGVGGAGMDMLSTRLRPVLSTGKDLQQGEVFGGKSWNTDDLPIHWSQDDWTKFMSVMFVAHGVPFFIGSAIENKDMYEKLNKAIGDDDGRVKNEFILDTVAQLFGSRSTPPSMKERIEKILGSKNIVVDGKKITKLDELDANPVAKAEFYRDPKIKALIDVYQGDRKKTASTRYYGSLEKEYQNQLQRDEWVEPGTNDKGMPYSLDDWEADEKARYLRADGYREMFTKDNPAYARLLEASKKKRSEDPNLKALDEYFAIAEQFKPSAGSQKMQPEFFDARQDFLDGLPEERREFILRNLGTSYTPFQRKVHDMKREAQPYFDFMYDIEKIADEGVKEFAKKYESAKTLQEKEELKDDPEYYAWQDIRKDLKREYLINHPDMIEKLKFLGHIKTSPSEDDAKQLEKAKKSVESALKSIEKFKAAVAKKEPFASSNLKSAQNRLKAAEEKVSIYEQLLQSTKEVEEGARAPGDALRPPTTAELKAAAAEKTKDAETKAAEAVKSAQRTTTTEQSGTRISEPAKPSPTARPVTPPKPAATPVPRKITLPGGLNKY